MGTSVLVKDVSKTFKLPHEKHTSLKSTIINFYGPRSYELQKALQAINFEVKSGEFFGIVGRNGSGKSTLLKLLAGIYEPDKGEITINGSLTPFIELGVGFNPELTGRENVFLNGALLGFSRKQMRAMYQSIVDFAEIERFMDQKLKNYSSGMQVRLAFSIAIQVDTDILLIDEVLAVGDALFQQKCFNTFKEIKKAGKTVIFVSHDLAAVESFCDRVMVLNRGQQVGIGETKPMIAEYKALLEEEAIKAEHGRAQQKVGERIATTGVFQITGAHLLNAAGNEVKEIDEAKPFTIRVNYRANKPVKDPTYGIGIMDSKGNSVLGPNTNEADFHHDITKGSGFFEAHFSHNVLAPGMYSVRASLSDEIGLIPQEFVEKLLIFRVKGNNRFGQIYVEPKWQVKQGGSHRSRT